MLRPQLPFEPLPHRSRTRRLAAGEVDDLVWIALEIVQLGPRRQYVFPASIADSTEVAPAVVHERHERLGERRLVAERGAAERGRETAPVGRAAVLHAEHLHDGRKQIDGSR